MSIRLILLGIVFLMVTNGVTGQNKSAKGQEYFYDTLTIMDYNTHEESVMQSRLFKPINRKFYLKTESLNYQLFNGSVANLTQDQFFDALKSGFSLYIDKREHKTHLNLKPSIMEIISEEGEVLVTFEDIYGDDATKLKAKLAPGTMARISGFIISVNEEKFGRITMDVKIIE